MSDCTVIQNITTTLQNRGLIDDKFNIIGNTEDVFPYIDKLNMHARTKYKVTEDLVLTKTIPSRLGASATVKVRFNHEVGRYIDSIKNNLENRDTMYQLENQKNQLGPSIEELDEYLKDFFKSFGVNFKEFDSLKDRLGVNALGATDILNKLIWYTKNRNEETVPEEVGHMAVSLMGINHPDIKELFNNIENWSEYQDVYDAYMPIYKDETKVKIEAMGKVIAKSLVNNYKAHGLDKNLLNRILDHIKNLLNSSSLFNAMNYSKNMGDKIAVNILRGDKKYISKLKTNNSNLNSEKALNENPLAKSIISTFSKLGGKLTGSLAISMQEKIQRPTSDPIHDIDFKVNNKDYADILKKVKELGGIPVHNGWKKSTYTTYAFFIPKKNHTVVASKINKGWVSEVTVYDENGKPVPSNSNNVISVDFFVQNGNSLNSNETIANASDIYKAKFNLSSLEKNYFFLREKDQQDYVNRKPRTFKTDSDYIFYQLDNKVDFQSRNNEEGNYVESSSEDFEGGEETFASSLSEDENYVENAPEVRDSLENLRLPITDNFGELLTYKKAQLNTLNKEITSLSKHTSEKSKELLKQKYKDKKKLENQIQELSDPENIILNMYHSVFTELENMQNDIDNDRINFDTFDSRLQFFRRFVHTDDFHIFKVLGEDYNKNIDNKTDQGYSSLLNLLHKVEENFKLAKEKGLNKIIITPKIEQILTGLNTKQVKNSKGELIDNEDYKKSRELLGKDEDYILTIEDLKIVDRDIDYFSKFALGIDDSQSGGGLVLATQMLKNEYVASQNFYSNYVANISEKILELHKKVNDTSFLIKKDDKGQDTLYLNKLFNQSWDEQSKNLQKAFNSFYKQNNHRLRKIEYQKIARELKNTSIVINPAKLPYFKVLMEKHSKYDERYKQYFTYSEEEMLNYENKLKSLLGPLYDTYIKEIEQNIQEFDEHIEDTLHTGGKYVENNIHRNNFWDYSRKLEEFNTSSTTNKMQIGTTSKGSEILFQNYKSLSIIPLDTIEGEKTSFYNEEFREIIKDSNKFELWKNVKELCSFISDTYSDNLDVQETNLMLPWFKESFKSSMANEKNFFKKVGKGVLEGLNEFQNIFKKDTSVNTKDESYIRKNYHNEAKVKINKKASLYQAQGMSRVNALEKATQEVLQDLKKDTLIENIIAVGNLAAQHTSRVATLPQAKLLAIYMQEMNNKMSGNLQKKFSGWFRGHILNTTAIETRTDSLFNKPIGKKKIYTTEEKIYKDKYERLKENNKLSVDNKVEINKVVNGKAYDLSYMVNEETNETHFLVNGESVSLETYQKEYEDYLQSELDSLGVDVNAVGIINGFMKLKILSALGLNPISGNFNRYEGIQTNASVDQTGEYWTPGNDIKSKRFLAGVNTKTLMSIIPSKFISVEQKKELLKYKKFIEHFASIQDKRNELEKANDKLGFQWEDMIYNFSQGLPEFKNQGQNILNLLQDIIIEKDGEIIQFFDGVNLNGIIENPDGSIEIHPNFVSELGDLKSEKMLDLYNKITTVINRIQGNYDKNDQLLLKGSLVGRMAMQMKTWMGAHIIQRYGSMQDKGQLNIDLATGKLRKNGRHVEFLHNHPYLAGLSILMSMANTKGGNALMALGGGLAIPVISVGSLAAWAFVTKGSKANYQANVKHTLNLAVFLREILLQSMNFLPRTVLSRDVLRTLENKSDKLKNRSFNNLTESDIMNMKAIALEMSAQLNMLILKGIAYTIASSLLGADDEDESSFTNVTHNFVQNQLARASTSIGNWGSMPIYGVLADSEKVALIQNLEQIINTFNKEDPELSDFTKIGAGILGVPVILTKMGNGLLPFQDEKNFDVQGKQKDFKWVHDTFFLDAESKAKKEYRKQRTEITDDFRSIVTEEFSNEEDVKIILNGLMEETVGIKDKDLSYEETLELLNENGKLDTRDTKDKIVEKLKEKGYTNEEIKEKMNNIYSNINR